MLDLANVRRQIEAMGNYRLQREDNREKLERAYQALKGADLDELREKVEGSHTSWLVATPLEDLMTHRPAPQTSEVLTVIAADGSQIYPTKHEIATCYLINVGLVTIHYGTGARPRLESKPFLYYSDRDMFATLDGRDVFITEDIVSTKRDIKELEELAGAAGDVDNDRVCLKDGTLIEWDLLGKPQDYRDRCVAELTAALDGFRRLGVPLAGYLSYPGGKDVINMLKVAICPYDVSDCDGCKFKPEPPCDAVEGLSDLMLQNWILKGGGERSALFKSSSKILESYGPHWIHFFYINVGSEIARVEVPEWVASDERLLNLVHGAVYDQVRKGDGYPVALAEAHERAVVRGTDRELFFRILEQTLVRKGIRARVSVKAASKRSLRV
ncbi:MAG: DNA double-strand break repair nuclease NurA [bacterium]